MRYLRTLALFAALGSVLLSARSAEANYTHVCCNVSNKELTAPAFAQVIPGGAGDITITWKTAVFSDSLVQYGASGPTWNIKPSVTTQNLVDVSLVTARVQWWVSDQRSVARTLDGWDTTGPLVVPTGSSGSFYGISATSDLSAWVVGTGGQIYRTVDGGATWTAQTSGVSTTLRKVKFSNDSWGLAVGDGGVLLFTRDSGATWTRVDGGAYPTIDFSSLGVGHDAVDPNLVDYWVGGTANTILQVHRDENLLTTTITPYSIPTLGSSYSVISLEVVRDLTGGDQIAVFAGATDGTNHRISTKVYSSSTFSTPNTTPESPLCFVEDWGGLYYWNCSPSGQLYNNGSATGPGLGVSANAGGSVAGYWTTIVGAQGKVMTAQRNTSVYYDATLASDHTVTLTGLNQATSYSFAITSVKKVNANYWQVYSSKHYYFTTRAADTTPPSPPTGMAATPLYNSFNSMRFYVDLTWNAAADAQSGIAGYEVSRGTTVIAALTTATGISDRKLSYGTTYTYSVRAKNGDGLYSTPTTITVTTLSPLTVTKSIGTNIGRNFTTMQAWEDARNGGLAYRAVLAVTPGTGKFTNRETVNGTGGCSGVYVPEDEASNNLPTLSLDIFSGTCSAGGTLTGATSGATATFGSVTSANGTIEVGEMYKESVFTAPVVIDFVSTLITPVDANHFLWLRPGPGQMHTGVAGTGVRIKLATGSTPVNVTDDYVRVWGLDIDSTPNTGFNGAGICFGYQGYYGQAAYNLIHDGDYTGICMADYVHDTQVYNNILYNLNRVGEYGSIQVTAARNAGGDTEYLYNNTIRNSGQKGIAYNGLLGGTLIIDARNNLVLKSATGNFGTFAGVSYGSSNSNAADDTSAPGSGSVSIPPGTALFHSVTAGSEDLRLYNQPNIGLVMDKAANLSASAGFSDDIIGRLRNDPNYTPWDIGAYEADKSGPSPAHSLNSPTCGWNATDGYYCDLTWSATDTDPESGIASHTVYDVSTPLVTGLSASATGTRVTNLAAATGYNFRVTSTNSDGFEGPTSNTWTIATPTPGVTMTLSKTKLVSTIGGSLDGLVVTLTSVDGYGGSSGLPVALDIVSAVDAPGETYTFTPSSVTLTESGANSSKTSTFAITGGLAGAGTYTTRVRATPTGIPAFWTDAPHYVTTFTVTGVNAPTSATVLTNSTYTFSFGVSYQVSQNPPTYQVTVPPAGGTSVASMSTANNGAITGGTFGDFGTNADTVTVVLNTGTTTGTFSIAPTIAYNGKTMAVPTPLSPLTINTPDSTPPIISFNLNTPTQNQVLSAAACATATGAGTAADNVGVTSVTYTVDGGASQTATGTTSWSFPLVCTAGTHALITTAHDAAGNVASTPARSYTVDSSAPAIAITSPLNGDTVYSSALTVTGTASDNVQVATVQVQLNSGAWTNVPITPAPTITPPWSLPVTLVSGANTIAARATDNAGNITTIPPITVTYSIPDFTFALNPSSSPPVNMGSSTTLGAQLKGTNAGYSRNITTTVVATGLPVGVTVGPNPQTSLVDSTATVTQTFTFTVGSGVAVGSYPIQVRANDGVLPVKTLTYTLNVVQPPDYTVTVAPDTVTVEAGQTATFPIALASLGGYTGTVNLSLTGLPASIPTATLAPAAVAVTSSGGSSTLSIPVPYDPATVNVTGYTLTLNATDGTITKPPLFLTLKVNPDSTNPQFLSGPAANPGTCPTATTCVASVTFTTDDKVNATVAYSPDLSFSSSSTVNCANPSNCTDLAVALGNLLQATTYNYRVTITNLFGGTTTSATKQFTTGMAPDITDPVVTSISVNPVTAGSVQGAITITVQATDNTAVASVRVTEVGPLHAAPGQVLAGFTGCPGVPATACTATATWDTNSSTNGATGEDNGTVTLTAVATDSSGRQSAPVSITITVANDHTPPVIAAGPTVNVSLAGSYATATISWNTDEASTTSVQYGLEVTSGTFTYGPWNDNLSLNTAHQVVLSNLQLNSRYHYQIRSCDASNNCVH